MGRVVTERGNEPAGRSGQTDPGKAAADAAVRAKDHVLLHHLAAGQERRPDGAGQGRGAGHIGKCRGRGVERDQIQRARLEREIARDRHRRARRAVAGQEDAARRDHGIADGARAGQRAAGIHGGENR